jgi:hypothetical protein
MTLAQAPLELQACIRYYWPESEWENAANISYLESGWNAFAVNDTTAAGTIPCGTPIGASGGVAVVAESSWGYFQFDVCNWPGWDGHRQWNADASCGSAHMLWANAGEKWTPWLLSARKLALA